MRNAKYCVFWPSIRENHNIFRYQQVRIRFNLLVRVSDSPDRNVSFLTAPNRAALSVLPVAGPKDFLRFGCKTQGKSSGFLKERSRGDVMLGVNPIIFAYTDENGSRA